VLALPGVVPSPGADFAPDDDWAQIEPVLVKAVERLQAMRQEEGARWRRSCCRIAIT